MSATSAIRTLPRPALRLPRITRGRAFAGIACLFGAAIAVNATQLQSEKHPAPMFRTLARPAAARVDMPVPPQRNETATREAAKDVPPAPAPRAEKAGRETPAAPAAADLNEFLLRDIQTELARRGFYKGEPDGMPGPATTRAIRDFQFSQRVAVDGLVSEKLLADIRAQRNTMKDELFDIVKRANAPEKPARKPEPRGEKPKASGKPEASKKPEAGAKLAQAGKAEPNRSAKSAPDKKSASAKPARADDAPAAAKAAPRRVAVASDASAGR